MQNHEGQARKAIDNTFKSRQKGIFFFKMVRILGTFCLVWVLSNETNNINDNIIKICLDYFMSKFDLILKTDKIGRTIH